jgi:hypothetical protein
MPSDLMTQFLTLVGSFACCGVVVVATVVFLLLSGRRRPRS